MDTGDLSSESDWQLMRNPPDTDQNAWNHGADLIEHFFSPNGPFWVEINSNGELIASDVQSQFNDRSGSGIDTGGGSDSVVQQQQIDNGIDFLPTRPPSEVLDAVVSTNQQSSSPASPDPALNSPSVVVSDKELPAAEKAEISKMSSSFLPSTFTGENDSDVSMDISPSPSPPVFRATTPLVVGREGALTLPYGTDGTAGRTPQSAQQPLQQVLATSSNGPIQTLRATPNMVAATALYGSSPYDRGRHTQSTDGAESLRRDMEQPNLLPATTTAIPFAGLSTQDTTSPAQKAANEEESAITPAKVTKKRTYTRKPKVATETNKSSLPEAAEDDGDDSAITLAKMPKKRTYTRKAKLTAEATTSSAQETAEASESNIALAKPIKKRAYNRILSHTDRLPRILLVVLLLLRQSPQLDSLAGIWPSLRLTNLLDRSACLARVLFLHLLLACEQTHLAARACILDIRLLALSAAVSFRLALGSLGYLGSWARQT